MPSNLARLLRPRSICANPLIVRPAGRGVAVVDALMRIAPGDPSEDPAEDSTGDPT